MANVAISPKRLIEVDLPIGRISEHARREKSKRHGHISTLHQWWARRPLAACRSVLLATLWPDPADPNCPPSFVAEAAKQMRALRDVRGGIPRNWDSPHELRQALLDFIAALADWELSSDLEVLAVARGLTQAAHESLGGASGSRPLVVDPFAGGGSIPHEALRVGAQAYASDLNPVATLLNKVILEYVPTFGARLADEVERWGRRINDAAKQELERYYPPSKDGRIPVAYLWARTARCEGPTCGATVPMLRSLVLSKKKGRFKALQLKPLLSDKAISFKVINVEREQEISVGTVKRGALVCPVCGFTTPAERVRQQFKGRRGGAADAQLITVVVDEPGQTGRAYREPTTEDADGVREAVEHLEQQKRDHRGPLPFIPDEPLPYLRSIFNIHLLDVRAWGDLFAPRQALAVATLGKHLAIARREMEQEIREPAFEAAVTTVLALVPNRCADYWSSLAGWIPVGEKIGHTFGRQALGIIWDFAEGNPFADISGSCDRCLGYIVEALRLLSSAQLEPGHVELASATSHPLPDDSAQAVVTDPPYYDAVPYADLSDFFYVWFRRTLGSVHPTLFTELLSPKRDEIVQLAERNKEYAYKTKERFETLMRTALTEARRVVEPNGIAVIVFAHKTTSAWETMLQAVLQAGWCVTASWPIDTEKPGRLRAQKSAALASSVHLVCRPRENSDGSVRANDIGDWREVLEELPRRIHEWMPRLAEEGVVGADAIFACLGPALEVFSRYSRVEKVSGEVVKLKEYLELVWAAVAREALATVLRDIDAGSLEPDARLSVIWLWTLGGGKTDGEDGEERSTGDDDEDESEVGTKANRGFVLEFDTARKIAQGLGASLEQLAQSVEVKGDKARLLPVAERATFLFGKVDTGSKAKKTPKKKQLVMFAELEAAAETEGWEEVGAPRAGATTLDRIHQAMLLFASGRGDALKRFLVDEGVGKQAQFWKLAQSLSALYPSTVDEKRWVDGVLARKKGLGF